MTFPMRRSNGRRLLWSAAVVLLAAPAHAADFSGPVVSVLDGDTIDVLHNFHPERVRLSGIDCPEKGQAFGTRAILALEVFVPGDLEPLVIDRVTVKWVKGSEFGVNFDTLQLKVAERITTLMATLVKTQQDSVHER